jgi:hypothetical protein
MGMGVGIGIGKGELFLGAAVRIPNAKYSRPCSRWYQASQKQKQEGIASTSYLFDCVLQVLGMGVGIAAREEQGVTRDSRRSRCGETSGSGGSVIAHGRCRHGPDAVCL